MSCTVVVGTQYGDEGKGKVVDYYSETADIIIRYNGGANAGHTVVIKEDKFAFRLLQHQRRARRAGRERAEAEGGSSVS